LFNGLVADRPGGFRGETGLDGIGADVVAGVGEEGLAVGIGGGGAGDADGGTGDHRESDHDTGNGLGTGGCNRGGEEVFGANVVDFVIGREFDLILSV
jgi:hypothetical protein